MSLLKPPPSPSAGMSPRPCWRGHAATAAGLALLVLAGCASPPTPTPRTSTPAVSVPRPAPGADGPPEVPGPDPQSVPDAEPRIEPIRSGGPNKPYEVAGQSYVPLARDEPLVETGLASWYGKKFHGRRTASGEVYNMHAMTAAHKTMPIPSFARVRNPANGREIIVRINDRGPFVAGRIIDLSYAAAMKLGTPSLARVEVSRLTHDDIRAMGQGGETRVARAEPAPEPSPPAARPVTPKPPRSRQGPAPANSSAPSITAAAVSASPATLPSAVPAPVPSPQEASAQPLASVQPTATAQPPVVAQPPGNSPALAAAQTPPATQALDGAAPTAGTPARSAMAAEPSAATSQAVPTTPLKTAQLPPTGVGAPAAQPLAALALPADAQTPGAGSPLARAYTQAAAGFWLQLGAFGRREGALDFHQKLSHELDWLAPWLAVFVDGALHRLQAGPYPSREQALESASRVRETVRLAPMLIERR